MAICRIQQSAKILKELDLKAVLKNNMIIRKITQNMVYAVIATDSVAARGLVNGRCLPRSGRRDILSVTITAFIFIGVILRIIVKNKGSRSQSTHDFGPGLPTDQKRFYFYD